MNKFRESVAKNVEDQLQANGCLHTNSLLARVGLTNLVHEQLDRLDTSAHTPTGYAFVSVNEALARGLEMTTVDPITGEKTVRVHSTSRPLGSECMQIRGYITAAGMVCRSGSMCTTPLLLVQEPQDVDGVITPGYAVTMSGSIYRLTTMPKTLDEVGRVYSELLRP